LGAPSQALASRRIIRMLTACLALVIPGYAQPLPGTQTLSFEGDLAARMVEGMHRFADRETERAVDSRQFFWRRGFSSDAAHQESVASHRERLRKIIGLIDGRIRFDAPALVAALSSPSQIASGNGYEIHAVRWPVLAGVDAEGLLLRPVKPIRARIVALPDADWTPEMLAGVSPGVPARAQFARRLAEAGCLVLVPALVDRRDTWSGNPDIRMTNQPHREFVYRMAYFVGRHIIGYEVQKVLAAVDWFSLSSPPLPVGVMGYGEGGLLALHSAAVDTRIDVAMVSGHFQPRQSMWQEPIYRNVWSFLREFGDAELAGLIAPRGLVIEASRHPDIPGPPETTKGRAGAAPGALGTPSLAEVQSEFTRASAFFQRLGEGRRISLVVSDEGRGYPGTGRAVAVFLKMLGLEATVAQAGDPPETRGLDARPEERQRRQLDQLVRFTQAAVLNSDSERKKFWSQADASSMEKWKQSTDWYRRYFWEEAVGKLPLPTSAGPAHTRRIYDEPDWTGYEVFLPLLGPDVFAYGILLLPKDVKLGERRPVVVCQHGLEGRPQELIRPALTRNDQVYGRFAAKLASRGFVVYAPQNPYIGGHRFRLLQRKLHPLKLSLFSLILAQHERTLDWLAAQSFVDPRRIGFYGLSYGGVTAVRVPPLLDRYALSICSANFNEWVWKTVRSDSRFAYLYGGEFEMFEFNFANTFNYAELANLMAPRPFMVERGHRDTVGPDEWVAYEYAKVRRHYALLRIPERTAIQFFDGGHVIHGVDTFRFLHRWLDWPEPRH